MTRGGRTVLARLLDALLPGVGLLWDGRRQAGWNTLLTWASLPSFLGTGVAFLDLDPRRAALVLAVAWVALQALLWLEPREAEAEPSAGRAVAGALVWAGLLAAAFLALSRSVTTVPVPDRACWPGLLPGETVLVRRADFRDAPPERGELVAARRGDRVVVARVAGLAGDRVEVNGPALRVGTDEMASEDLGDVTLEDPDGDPTEALRLRAFLEILGERRHLVFHARGVTSPVLRLEVPEGHVFLLADNRSSADAADSRTLGPVALDALAGRVETVLWSPGGGAVPRWDRIGLRWP